MKTILLASIIFITLNVAAQDYNSALGFRIGETAGITYKIMTNEENALYGLASFQRGGVQLTVMRQYQHPIFFQINNQFFCYYGYGAHLGYATLSSDVYRFSNKNYRRREFSFGFGVDGIFGIEYHVLRFPVVLAVDVKPYFDLSFPAFFRNNNSDFGFSLMYCF